MDHDLICYQFSRSKVERADFSHFLSLYAPDKLPSGRGLQKMMGQFLFCIEGYDADPRELHSIPEVRRFYSAFHAAWPYWLYFCNLEEGDQTLRMMVMCCLPSINALHVARQPTGAITYPPLDLLNFLSQDFRPMNEMCERAEMFERYIYDRTKAVFEY